METNPIFHPYVFIVVGQDCGGDWIRYGDTCYLVQTKRLFWGEGRKDCQAQNGDLAVANTPEIHVSTDLLLLLLG